MHLVTSSWRNCASAKCPPFALAMATSLSGPNPVLTAPRPVTIGDVSGSEDESSAMLRAEGVGADMARETCCTSDTTQATTVSGESFQCSVCVSAQASRRNEQGGTVSRQQATTRVW